MCLLVFRIQQKVALIQQEFYCQYFVVQFIGIFCLFNKQFIVNTSLYTYRSQVLGIKNPTWSTYWTYMLWSLKKCANALLLLKMGFYFDSRAYYPGCYYYDYDTGILLKSLLLIWRSTTGELIQLLPIFKTIYNDLNVRDKILTRNISELGHSKTKFSCVFSLIENYRISKWDTTQNASMIYWFLSIWNWNMHVIYSTILDATTTLSLFFR